jgi:peptide/nickel transport system permease protein
LETVFVGPLLKPALHILATAILGVLLAGALIRMAPGFGIDERELDLRLNDDSVRRIRAEAGAGRSLWSFYMAYGRGLATGDLGTSQALGRPVSELLRERIPVTFGTAGTGLLASWTGALALAILSVRCRNTFVDAACAALNSLLLCLPAAALGLLTVLVSGQAGRRAMVAVAIALVVFPRLFRLTRGILAEALSSPHVSCAIARGVSPVRLIAWHVLAPSAGPLLALAGVSTTLAFGAAIPIEVVCDSPGLGQLAWQAALQRDFPLLVNLGLIVCLLVAGSNALSHAAAGLVGREKQGR